MVAIKASWPLRPPSTRAILAAFPSAQPSSGRWLRWLCPGHPPGRMMAGIQPSQPSAGGWLSLPPLARGQGSLARSPIPIIRPAGCASELPGPGCEAADCTPSAPSLLYPDQAFQREMAERSRRQPSRTRVWWLAEREQSHLRSCRGRREGRVEFATAILRPMAAMAVCQPSCGRADGRDTAIAAIGRRMAALAGWQPKWRVLVGRSG